MGFCRNAVKSLAILVLFILLPAQQVLAQARVTITEGNVEPISIAITDFTDTNGSPNIYGRTIAQIISDDLADSGLFRPEDAAAQIPVTVYPGRPDFADWQPLGVDALLVGTATRIGEGDINIAFTLWDVATQQRISSAEGATPAHGLRRISHQIADVVYEGMTGDKGYFDTRIVYVEESGPQGRRVKRLAIMDHDGHNHHYLTGGESLVLTPRFAPQAQEIAYLDYFDDNPNIYLMDVSTGNTELLGRFPGMSFAPRFSFDGRKLIMSLARGGSTDIFEMNLQTRELRQLTRTRDIDTSPSYSPDGTQIVFNSDRSGTQQLYIMDAEGGNVRRISNGRGRYATPVWSPRGDLIAFTKSESGVFRIGVMNTDGSGERTIAEGFLVEAPTWSPNGRVLIYFKHGRVNADGTGGDPYLYRVDITGFNEKRLNTPGPASDPAWSPLLP